MKRYAARRDANEPELVHLARMLGAKMRQLHVPSDWLMAYRGQWHLVEIKTATGSFTKPQLEFRAWASTVGAPPIIVWRTDADVYRTLGAKVSA